MGITLDEYVLRLAESEAEAGRVTRRMSLAQAARNAKAIGGLYVILRDGRPVYAGQSANLRARMTQHRRLARTLCGHERFSVRLTYMPRLPEARRRALEGRLIRRINRVLHRQKRAPLTNTLLTALREAEWELRQPGAEYMARGGHRRGARRSTYDDHTVAEGRRTGEQTRSEARTEETRRAIARQRRARALALTGRENPTIDQVVTLIEQAESRLTRVSRAIAVANRIGDARRAALLEAERVRLIGRIRDLRQFRLGMR
jgi:hypothetical protein